MLGISLVGNLLQSLLCLSQIQELEQALYRDPSDECFIFYRIRQAGNLFFHYLVFFPYVLRAYRLHFIFKLDKNWDSQEFSFNKYMHRTREIWMLWILCLLMIPFLILIVIILQYCHFSEYLPASESNRHIIYSQSSYLLICFLEQFAFILSIYSLKEVTDDYNMTNELTAAMILWFITPIFSVFPIKFGIYQSLPGLIRNVLLLFFSFLYPIICSFKDDQLTDNITMEMLSSLDLILQSKITIEHFEEFLKEIEGKTNESNAQVSGYDLLHLFMKCENFLYFPELCDKDELINELLRSDIITINYSYDSKEKIEDHVMKAKEEILFYISQEYFHRFKRSKQYAYLQKMIHRQEIYHGRLITIGLRGTIYSNIGDLPKKLVKQ